MVKRWLRKALGWQLAVALVIGLVAGLAGGALTVTDNEPIGNDALSWDVGGRTITVGYPADAAGSLDYTFDGVADNVQLQAALDALPATGGRIVIVSATTIQFANATTITRAIDNVAIMGTGAGTAFAGDGVTSPITAGGNNWVLSGFSTDVTTTVLETAMGATTGWSWENVTTSDGYLAYRTDDATGAASWDIPVGRGATYVVAASNAPDHVKAQADYVCDGTDDLSGELQDAIDAAPDNSKIELTAGTFYISSNDSPVAITNRNDLMLAGQGAGTLLRFTDQTETSNFISVSGGSNITVRDLRIDGTTSDGTTKRGISVVSTANPRVENCYVSNVSGIGIAFFTNGPATITNIQCHNNTCTNNASMGIHIRDTNEVAALAGGTVSGNICNDNTIDGISIDYLGHLQIIGNFTSGNDRYGIHACIAPNNSFVGNTCRDDGDGGNDAGIYLTASDNSAVVGNSLRGCYYGIWVNECDGITISDNFIYDCTTIYYIRCQNSDYFAISGNACEGMIQTFSSSYGSISGNTVYNGREGIHLSGGSHNSVSGNSCSGCERNGILVEAGHNAIIGNVCYDNDKSSSGYSGIRVVSADNNMIQANVCRKGAAPGQDRGIELTAGSDDNWVIDNDVRDGGTGQNFRDLDGDNIVRNNQGYTLPVM